MSLAAALTYWVIVALWGAVLVTLCVAFARNPKTFGAMRLLLAVLLLDTARNLSENIYFGLYWGGQYGLFPATVTDVLGNPLYLMSMKVMTVLAATAVLFVLSMYWLPMAMREWNNADTAMRKQTKTLNQESEERRQLFDTSLDLILITNRAGEFVRASPSSLATLGFKPHEMIGRSGTEFIHAEDIGSVRHEMRLARKTGKLLRNIECRYTHKDGRHVPLSWSGVWSESEQQHYFIGRDMTEQHIAEEKLRQLAHFDKLTGLHNRASLHEDLGSLLETTDNPRPVSIAMLDLDGFKDINDTLGHSVGDKLLQEVAARMTEIAGVNRAYRLGGDEFILVMADCGDPLIISGAVQKILDRLAERYTIDGHSLFVSASAGIAIAPSDGSNVDELVSNADLALYASKEAGGRIYRFFTPPLRTKAEGRRNLEIELRRACTNGEFELHFQPQIRPDNHKIAGAEALLRWNHPERGMLAPGAFIEALAESAVAPEVGSWILNTACKTIANWRTLHGSDLRVAVNLFPAQFRSGTLLEDVEQALAASGLPPEALELEITENIALDHDDSVLAPLKKLRARGIGIAFDDFGTGYASLSYLTRYPLTRIKIDRSFVQKIGKSPTREDTAIVRSIIAMAANLGLEVTAEGVETTAQWSFLQAEGCHELQGFLFSRPLPAEKFGRFLTGWSSDHTEKHASVG